MIPQPPSQDLARKRLGDYKKAAAALEKAHVRCVKAKSIGDGLYALRGLLEAWEELDAVRDVTLDCYGISQGFPPVIDNPEEDASP